jgi:hypothetical protein
VVRRRAADVVDLRGARPHLVLQVVQIPSDEPHTSFIFFELHIYIFLSKFF